MLFSSITNLEPVEIIVQKVQHTMQLFPVVTVLVNLTNVG